MSLPLGPYDLVLADPAWKFSSNSAANPGRNPQRHYACIATADILALPVRAIAARDSLLFLWVTSPFLKIGLDVVEAWGFKYVSSLCWPKQRIGTGYWVRGKHEMVLIGKRGKFPAPKPAMFPTSLIPGTQREHSRKPDWLQDVIDEKLPDARKLELFARQQRPGWKSWGNETEKFGG